ncbi:protein rolling stone [Strongylocentrotus purpuratus]|uniref:Protein rolling stone n=1 Tax=Strongylocentrotus purpuratus TaxID=7668 RepID=A0A7M7P8W5_STRPU|nr:protein rolling stone [Strongylocentrotus purpuratus]
MSTRSRSCSCSRPKCSDFGLGGVSPSVYVTTQCPMHYGVYLAYRILITLYLLGYFLYVFIVSVRPGGPYGGYFFIYLTNWGYILMLVYQICALWNIIVYAAFMKPAGWTSDDVPWYFFHRGQWLLFNMYASVAILLSLLYWGALYVPGTVDLYYDINFHTLNGIVALIEIFLSAMVIRLLHFIYPFMFAVAYVVFAGIYYAAGGTDEEGNPSIYSILDFGANPGLAAGLAIGAVVVVVVVHILIVWGLHKLKVLIFDRCCPSCFPNENVENRDPVELEGDSQELKV